MRTLTISFKNFAITDTFNPVAMPPTESQLRRAVILGYDEICMYGLPVDLLGGFVADNLDFLLNSYAHLEVQLSREEKFAHVLALEGTNIYLRAQMNRLSEETQLTFQVYSYSKRQTEK